MKQILRFFSTPGFTSELVKNNGRPLYLDMQATTPLDSRALDKMLPYLTHYFGNPHSRTHIYGWETEKAVEIGRAVILNPHHSKLQT